MPEDSLAQNDQELINRAMKALEKLADTITTFRCASELAARGNTDASRLAAIARAELVALLTRSEEGFSI